MQKRLELLNNAKYATRYMYTKPLVTRHEDLILTRPLQFQARCIAHIISGLVKLLCLES